jgi:hypothetical protein
VSSRRSAATAEAVLQVTTVVTPKIGLARIGCADEVFDRVEVPASLRLLRHHVLDDLSQEIGSLKPSTCSYAREISRNLFRESERKLGIRSLSHALHFAVQRLRVKLDRELAGLEVRETRPPAAASLDSASQVREIVC